MSGFTSRLAASQCDDGVHWSLTEDLHYNDDKLGLIVVPIGFVTDGGSVPPFFQEFVNPYGKGFKAFAIHDYLYATQKFTREESDECLGRALNACGENWFDSKTQTDAVRLGGEKAWEEDKIKYSIH